MHTQKFMGRGQLIERLTAQIGDRDTAVKVLQARGQLKEDGKTFTPEGAARNSMTAEERAKDRAAKKANLPPSAFVYNPKTNTAKKRLKRI